MMNLNPQRGMAFTALALIGLAATGGPALAGETDHCLLQADVTVKKEVEPHPEMRPGLPVNYLVTARNDGATTAILNVADDMTETFDDATITASPVLSTGTVTPTESKYLWNLTLDPGVTATMRYSVKVKAWEQLGDGRVRNAITAQTQGGAAQSCQFEMVLPPQGAADTGDGSTILTAPRAIATATAATVAAVGVGGLVLIRRKRRLPA